MFVMVIFVLMVVCWMGSVILGWLMILLMVMLLFVLVGLWGIWILMGNMLLSFNMSVLLILMSRAKLKLLKMAVFFVLILLGVVWVGIVCCVGIVAVLWVVC